MARRYNSEESKKRILSACVKLFVQKGYHHTTMAEILKEADVTNSTFQNIFHSKDGVLLDLTEMMFKSQFDAATGIKKDMPPIYVYAVETAIQMAITESDENLRDIYIEAYSNEKTMEYIFRQTSEKLYEIFSGYNPEYSKSDFYELEIGTAGIMRNYMMKRCDMYFTFEKKFERFLVMSLKAYNVPQREIDEILLTVINMDIMTLSNRIMHKLFESLAMEFEFKLGKK